MQSHPIGRNTQFLLQTLDEADQMSDLTIREGATLSVADQTDPDGVLVQVPGVGSDDVGPGQLLVPPIAHMHFAVGESVSVADQEVIAKALIAPPQMASVHGFGGSERFTEVMDDDPGPSIPVELTIEDEHRVGIGAILEISETGQRKAGRFGGGVQIQENHDGRHGREEAPEDDLRPPGNRCPWNVASVLGHWAQGSREGFLGEGSRRKFNSPPDSLYRITPRG